MFRSLLQCVAVQNLGFRCWDPHLAIFQFNMIQCNTLQHTLQHTAAHCNALQHTATHCNTLQHTAANRITLQHIVTHCSTLQHLAWCNVTCEDSIVPAAETCIYAKRPINRPISMKVDLFPCKQTYKRDLYPWKEIYKRDLQLALFRFNMIQCNTRRFDCTASRKIDLQK